MDLFIGLIIGILSGFGIAYFLLSSAHGKTKQQLARVEAKYEAELKAADEKLKLLEEARDNLKDSFKALSADALSKNNESFIKLAEEKRISTPTLKVLYALVKGVEINFTRDI